MTKKEPNRGALVRASILCVERALTHLIAAGNLLKLAGMRDEECGILIANAYLHARRTMPQLKELSDLWPDREKVGA
jgi:hypothetical protein